MRGLTTATSTRLLLHMFKGIPASSRGCTIHTGPLTNCTALPAPNPKAPTLNPQHHTDAHAPLTRIRQAHHKHGELQHTQVPAVPAVDGQCRLLLGTLGLRLCTANSDNADAPALAQKFAASGMGEQNKAALRRSPRTWHEAQPLEDAAKHGGVREEEAEGCHGQRPIAHVVAAAH